jgi:regulator of protease activity HflC (stomatin/prohibitin superfamily)
MFDRLLDLAIEFVELFQVFVYIDHWDRGLVMRCGKYHRTVDPGLRWVLPLGIEDIIDVNVKPEPLYIDNQSIHALDDYLINVQVALSFRITDPKVYALEWEDTDVLLNIMVADLIAKAIKAAKWADIRDGSFLHDVEIKAKRKARKYGLKILELNLIDCANGSANRLWHDGIDSEIGHDD